jgi:hypothetical protein
MWKIDAKVCKRLLCLTFVGKGGEGHNWVEENNSIFLFYTYFQVIFSLSNFDKGYIKNDLTMETQGCNLI